MICRLCDSDSVVELIDFGRHPIVHNLKKAQYDKSKDYVFKLGSCSKCGFLQLMEPISPEVLYKNYLFMSGWKNQPHISRLIEVMESISGINYHNPILDIGCNDGSFLKSLREVGYSNLYGVEPTSDAFNIAIKNDLNVYSGFFGYEFSKNVYDKGKFNVVTTRQVLEHIVDLADFLKGIRYVLKDDGVLVIEVPESEWNLDYLDYALWEEHVNYFTINTLEMLLSRHGFRIIHYETTLFSGKALTVYCEKVNFVNIEYSNYDLEKINKYEKHFPVFKTEIQKFLREKEHPVIMYGCGARSSNFINFTEIGDLISCFVDDQVEKQGLYVPGCNLKINPWDRKYANNHTVILGVNTENEYKVIHRNKLNMQNVYSSTPPSANLPMFWKNMIYD